MNEKIELAGHILTIAVSHYPDAKDKNKRVVTDIELHTNDGIYALSAYGKKLVREIKDMIIGEGSRIYVTGVLGKDNKVDVSAVKKLLTRQVRPGAG